MLIFFKPIFISLFILSIFATFAFAVAGASESATSSILTDAITSTNEQIKIGGQKHYGIGNTDEVAVKIIKVVNIPSEDISEVETFNTVGGYSVNLYMEVQYGNNITINSVNLSIREYYNNSSIVKNVSLSLLQHLPIETTSNGIVVNKSIYKATWDSTTSSPMIYNNFYCFKGIVNYNNSYVATSPEVITNVKNTVISSISPSNHFVIAKNQESMDFTVVLDDYKTNNSYDIVLYIYDVLNINTPVRIISKNNAVGLYHNINWDLKYDDDTSIIGTGGLYTYDLVVIRLDGDTQAYISEYLKLIRKNLLYESIIGNITYMYELNEAPYSDTTAVYLYDDTSYLQSFTTLNGANHWDSGHIQANYEANSLLTLIKSYDSRSIQYRNKQPKPMLEQGVKFDDTNGNENNTSQNTVSIEVMKTNPFEHPYTDALENINGVIGGKVYLVAKLDVAPGSRVSSNQGNFSVILKDDWSGYQDGISRSIKKIDVDLSTGWFKYMGNDNDTILWSNSISINPSNTENTTIDEIYTYYKLIGEWDTTKEPNVEYYDEHEDEWMRFNNKPTGHNGVHSINISHSNGESLNSFIFESLSDTNLPLQWNQNPVTISAVKEIEIENLAVDYMIAEFNGVENIDYFVYVNDQHSMFNRPEVKFTFKDVNLDNIPHYYKVTLIIWKTANDNICGEGVTYAEIKDTADGLVEMSGFFVPGQEYAITWDGTLAGTYEDENGNTVVYGTDTAESSTYTYDIWIEEYSDNSISAVLLDEFAYKWPYCSTVDAHCLHAINNIDELTCERLSLPEGDGDEGGGLPSFAPFNTLFNPFMMAPMSSQSVIIPNPPPIIEGNLDCGYYDEYDNWVWDENLGYIENDENWYWFSDFGCYYNDEWTWNNDLGFYNGNDEWVWNTFYGYYDSLGGWNFYDQYDFFLNELKTNQPPITEGNLDCGYYDEYDNWIWDENLGSYLEVNGNYKWIWNPQFGYYVDEDYDIWVWHNYLGEYDENNQWVWSDYFGYYDSLNEWHFYSMNGFVDTNSELLIGSKLFYAYKVYDYCNKNDKLNKKSIPELNINILDNNFDVVKTTNLSDITPGVSYPEGENVNEHFIADESDLDSDYYDGWRSIYTGTDDCWTAYRRDHKISNTLAVNIVNGSKNTDGMDCDCPEYRMAHEGYRPSQKGSAYIFIGDTSILTVYEGDEITWQGSKLKLKANIKLFTVKKGRRIGIAPVGQTANFYASALNDMKYEVHILNKATINDIKEYAPKANALVFIGHSESGENFIAYPLEDVAESKDELSSSVKQDIWTERQDYYNGYYSHRGIYENQFQYHVIVACSCYLNSESKLENRLFLGQQGAYRVVLDNLYKTHPLLLVAVSPATAIAQTINYNIQKKDFKDKVNSANAEWFNQHNLWSN